MTVMKWMFWILPILDLGERAQGQQTAQSQVQPQVVGRPIRDGQVTTVFLAPRYVTAIRMPEPINSVVVGDPASFSAEHSDREPNLVFVKPITTKAAQTNLLISSTRGLQASLLLISRGEPKEEGQRAVDFLMRYKPAGQFMIQPADSPSVMIPQTVAVGSTSNCVFRLGSVSCRLCPPRQPLAAARRNDRLRSHRLQRIQRSWIGLLSMSFWTVNGVRHCPSSTGRSRVSRHRGRNWLKPGSAR